MADQVLLEGVRLFEKKPTQPDFVLATGVITPNDLVAFLKTHPELMSEYNGQKQVRIQLLKSKAGKPYIAVDTWKPEDKAEAVAPGNVGSGYQPTALPSKEELDDLPF